MHSGAAQSIGIEIFGLSAAYGVDFYPPAFQGTRIVLNQVVRAGRQAYFLEGPALAHKVFEMMPDKLNFFIEGRQVLHQGGTPMKEGPVSLLCVRAAVKIIDRLPFQELHGPPLGLLGGPVIDPELSAPSPHIDTAG